MKEKQSHAETQKPKKTLRLPFPTGRYRVACFATQRYREPRSGTRTPNGECASA
ncbi:hypothetical protein NIES2111_53920 [Nostoc sp. NIES-2111]|nr:hypothetical protein NIES2111_53920 [Nostoc sp. NIES-2111]